MFISIHDNIYDQAQDCISSKVFGAQFVGLENVYKFKRNYS